MNCDKIGYATLGEAKKHQKGLLIKYSTKKQSCSIYKCANCSLYHVTTTYKSPKLQRPKKDLKYDNISTSYKHSKKYKSNHHPNYIPEKPIITTGKFMTAEQILILKQLINASENIKK